MPFFRCFFRGKYDFDSGMGEMQFFQCTCNEANQEQMSEKMILSAAFKVYVKFDS
ncbi:MAG: hypothetical protein ACJAYM_001046 [Flavobacteriales bacterium]|jgi:hypothetical protein